MFLSIICGVVHADKPDVVAHWNFGTEENTRLEHRTVASLGIDPGEYLFDGDRPLPITDNGQPIAKLFGSSCLEPTNLKQHRHHDSIIVYIFTVALLVACARNRT